jgi:hypothetical protein
MRKSAKVPVPNRINPLSWEEIKLRTVHLKRKNQVLEHRKEIKIRIQNKYKAEQVVIIVIGHEKTGLRATKARDSHKEKNKGKIGRLKMSRDKSLPLNQKGRTPDSISIRDNFNIFISV